MERLKGWLPIRIWAQDGEWRVDWCWFGERRLEQSFFRDSVDDALRLPFNQVFRRETPLQVLCDWPAADVAPTAFIHHASRCGSTLLCQMLARLDEFIVVSEPPALDVLLRAELEPGVRQAALRGLLAAYGQARCGSERALVIKCDAWNIGELPLLQAAFSDTPWLFLYREPLEIVVSHLRAAGMHMVPGMIGASCLDDEAEDDATREDYIAARLGRILAQGLKHCLALGGQPLNYSQLPGAMNGQLGDLFGLDNHQRSLAFAATSQHAKQPVQAFAADSRAKQQEASVLLRARVQYRTQDVYQALELLRQQRGQTVVSLT